MNATGTVPRLAGKTAIVTGAAYGIGAEIARRFCAEGANVVATDVIDPEAAPDGAGAPGSIVFERADVLDPTDRARVIELCSAANGRVDILVNNAASTIGGWIHEYSEESWDRVYGIVAKGTFLSCQGVLPLMVEQGGGSIINLGSSAISMPTPLSPAYGPAKAAVERFSRQVALDYGPWNVRCNVLAPGPTLTPKTRKSYYDGDTINPQGRWLIDTVPLGRFADPAELASSALFLASDESSFVSGVTLLVDGGKSTHAGAMRPPSLSPDPGFARSRYQQED